MKYRKKPVVIEAIQFFDTDESVFELAELMNANYLDLHISYKDKDDPKIIIETLEGEMKGSVGDYIIKGVNGEFYPCKPDIFEKTYDKVEDEE